MKEVSIIFFIVSLIVVWAVLSGREGYVDFQDKSNETRTSQLKDSSYSQTTNHAVPNKQFEAPNIQGYETPYRVNMFTFFQP
jgi:hypothetical protein